jgi:hypothetical protein
MLVLSGPYCSSDDSAFFEPKPDMLSFDRRLVEGDDVRRGNAPLDTIFSFLCPSEALKTIIAQYDSTIIRCCCCCCVVVVIVAFLIVVDLFVLVRTYMTLYNNNRVSCKSLIVR